MSGELVEKKDSMENVTDPEERVTIAKREKSNMVQNKPETGRKYWATCLLILSLVRSHHVFIRLLHTAFLADTHCDALIHSLACSLTPKLMRK